MFKTIALALFGALTLTAASVTPAQAQTIDERSYFNFSQPVHIPGKVLEPGRYMFRLADWDTGRKVVQILNEDMTEVHGLVFTERVMRANAPGAPEVSLGEAPEGEARSISTWWVAGDIYGRAFLYAPGDASWQRESVGRDSDD